MDSANQDAFEAVPIQCFACAARDAESRFAAEARSSGSHATAAFDGIYYAVEEKKRD